MRLSLYSLSFFAIIWQPTLSFYGSCRYSKNILLSTEDCNDLYFAPSEKTTPLGNAKLELEEDSFRVTPTTSSWSTSYLRVTTPNNASNEFCSKLTNRGSHGSYCFTLLPEMINQTFMIEYEIEKLPEISSRKFLFTLPDQTRAPLFLYVDQTDTSRLILRAQKFLSSYNVTSYKVEAYKEKNGNTNLQDLRVFSSNDEIVYELFTYNDVGNYYFVVWLMSGNCIEGMCLKLTTPEVFIGRRGTHVVIGIVGASFILPFILFVFHILTKKYPQDRSLQLETLVIAYKSSSKKHNEVVASLAALLENLINNCTIDVIDLSKARKFSQKFCIDSLHSANRMIYVTSPKNDSHSIVVSKSSSEKEIFAVIFDYCTDQLPQFFTNDNTFRLFEDLGRFFGALNISKSHNIPLYQDLLKKTEEAIKETEQADDLPKIIVTDFEPQEHDSLISAKI